MSRDLLCRLAQFCALAAMLLMVIELGLFGLTAPGGVAGDSLIVVVALLLGAGLLALRQATAPGAAAQTRHGQGVYGLLEIDMGREIARTVVSGLIFVAILYHLAGFIRAFKPIRVAVNDLLPAWAYDALMLAPALAIVIIAGVVRRRPGRKAARR